MSLIVADDLTKTYTTGSVRVEALKLKTPRAQHKGASRISR
jgi:hypothetical protein